MKDKAYLVGLKLSGKRCLVVGNGDEAALRAEILAEAGARVLLISETPSARVLACSQTEGVDIAVRAFAEEDLDGMFLSVLADRDEHLARRLQLAAEKKNTLFCAIDQPSYGNFSHLAIARVGSVSIGVATDGRAPALSRRLREELQRLLSESDIETLVDALAALRTKTPSADRRDVLSHAVENVRLTGKLEWREEDDESGADRQKD